MVKIGYIAYPVYARPHARRLEPIPRSRISGRGAPFSGFLTGLVYLNVTQGQIYVDLCNARCSLGIGRIERN